MKFESMKCPRCWGRSWLPGPYSPDRRGTPFPDLATGSLCSMTLMHIDDHSASCSAILHKCHLLMSSPSGFIMSRNVKMSTGAAETGSPSHCSLPRHSSPDWYCGPVTCALVDATNDEYAIAENKRPENDGHSKTEGLELDGLEDDEQTLNRISGCDKMDWNNCVTY